MKSIGGVVVDTADMTRQGEAVLASLAPIIDDDCSQESSSLDMVTFDLGT